jgi:outer membrane murein-binding lipoprotein Lpp
MIGALVCEIGRSKMRIWAAAVACGMLLALCGNVARSDTDECRDALDHYNSARSDVSSALRQYGRCVSDSKVHDDCASEFSTLHSAQDDFESAVSEYHDKCSH